MSYKEKMIESDRLLKADDLPASLAAVNSIATETLNPFERMMVCAQQAAVYGKLSHINDALAAYDQAIAQESMAHSAYASLKKADYLYEIGRELEWMEIERQIAARSTLTPDERERVEWNIRTMGYRSKLDKAGQLSETQDFDGAIAIIESIQIADLTQFEKMMIFLNLAIMQGSAKRVEAALAAYDDAIAMEKQIQCASASVQKAYYLLELGRDREGLEIYKDLLSGNNLTAEEREGLEANIKVIEGRPR